MHSFRGLFDAAAWRKFLMLEQDQAFDELEERIREREAMTLQLLEERVMQAAESVLRGQERFVPIIEDVREIRRDVEILHDKGRS